MSNHFIAINRGKDGFKQSDYTFGSATSAGTDVELRIADGASLTRKDVKIALKAFMRTMEDRTLSNFPPL